MSETDRPPPILLDSPQVITEPARAKNPSMVSQSVKVPVVASAGLATSPSIAEGTPVRPGPRTSSFEKLVTEPMLIP
jgi:hypothetical protein